MIKRWMLLCFLMCFSETGFAVESEDVDFQAVMKLMDDGQWQKASEILKKMRARLVDADAKPSQLATVDYHLGLSHLQLAHAESAAHRQNQAEAYFLKAAKDFEASVAVSASAGNINRARSLWRLGIAQQGLGQYEQALTSYESFLLERNQVTDVYDQGLFVANLIICESKKAKPDLRRAAERMGELLDKRDFWKVKDEVWMSGLYGYASAAIKAGELDALNSWFTAGKVKISADAGKEVLWKVADLGSRSLAVGELDIAKNFLQLLPADLARQSGDIAADQLWFTVSELRAALLERDGELKQAVAVLAELIKSKQQPERRSAISLALARMTLQLGDAVSTLQWVQSAQEDAGLKESMRVELRKIELGALFQLGNYNQVVEQVSALLDKDAGSVSEDGVFLAAGAAYHLGDAAELQRWTGLYQEKFPKGGHRDTLTFYRAALLVSQSRWQQAGALLGELLAQKSLDPALRVSTQYQLAVMDFSLGKYKEVMQQTAELLEADSIAESQRVAVLLLSAQALDVVHQREAAAQHYRQALALAEKAKLKEESAEALFYLVAFYGREKVGQDANPELAEALPFFEKFMESYAGSPYAAQAITAVMPAMLAAKREKEIFSIAVKKIEELSTQDDPPGLQLLVSAYLWARVDAGESLKEITNECKEDKAGAAVLVYGLLDIYEAGLRQAGMSIGRALTYHGIKLQLLAWLGEHAPSQPYPGYMAAGMAERLLASSGASDVQLDALLQRALASKLLDTRQSAEVSQAVRLRGQGQGGSLTRAIEILSEVIQQQPRNQDTAEYAYIELAETLIAEKRWEDLTARAKEYLDNATFSNHRAEMTGYLGLSYDKRGMVEDAIACYTNVFVSYTGYIEVSAPAVQRLIQLTWQRNTPARGEIPSDRQTAYHLGHRYLTLTDNTYVIAVLPQQIQRTISLIRNLVNEWEQSGEVVSVKQMLREAREGKRPVVGP